MGAKTENVGKVMLPGMLGDFWIIAERGAHVREAVGGNRHAHARGANKDTLAKGAGGDG